MSGLLTRVVLPLLALVLVVTAISITVGMGWVPETVGYWLWPALIAFLLLIALVVALLLRAYRLLWPLGAGLIVQTAGLLLFWVFEYYDHPWQPFWYTLGAMGVTVLVMGIIYVVNTVRARLLERRMAEGGGGGSPEDTARIRKDMLEALDLLRQAGRGRNAIYELPWFLVMGRPAAGKTVAIKNSELGLPVKRDWVKGVGGTYTADWFFTNEMIFLDTPGKWVTEGASADGQAHWRELVRLLRRYRGRQPLDGLIVVVPADDLLSLGDDAIEEQAANIREVVDLIHTELNFRFPIYLLVSKCDLVDGFVDFFKVLPAKRRHEILGWSNEEPNRKDFDRLIEEGFSRVNRHLETYRLEMLGKVAKRTQARRLFFFTEEFKALERPLGLFTDAFFSGDRYSETPVFRGFYFTSGTQEGAPLSKAMAELSRALGVTAAKTEEAEGETKRSYFLLDLFRELMVGDEGLVGRTAGHWWRFRRNSFLGAFAPAGIALVFLVLSMLSFGLNKGTYSRIESSTAGITSSLAAMRQSPDWLSGDTMRAALEETAKLQTYHSQLVGFHPLRRWGMRRPKGLDQQTFDLYREELSDTVLYPTLAEAQRLATDPEESCVARISVLHSVVWLRMGRRAGFSDLAGLDPVWGLDEANLADEAAEVRRELRRQYTHLKKYTSEADAGRLLEGFDVRTAAKSIANECGKQGALSTLEMYRQFQDRCRTAPTPADVDVCWGELRKVFQNAKLDYAGFSKRFNRLKADLTELKAELAEAEYALQELGGIDLQHEQTSSCLAEFDQTISPKIEEFARRDDLLLECQKQVNAVSGRGEKYRTRETVLETQKPIQAPEKQVLSSMFNNYTGSCTGAIDGFTGLDMAILENIALSRRRVECYRRDGGPKKPTRVAQQRPAPAPAKKTPGSRPAPRPAPSRSTSKYQWFDAPTAVSRSYRPSSWDGLQGEWQARLEAAETGFDAAQRDHEEGQVRDEISGYASSYARAWVKYLKSLALQPPAGQAAVWLAELAETTEYDQLLGPAMEAAALAESAGEAPFDVMARKLEPLQGLGELDLDEYRSMLGTVAEDLARCEDPAEFHQYRASLLAGRDENSLVRTRKWVLRKAGPSLLEGSLTALLKAPLDYAESFVRSDSLLIGQWEAMRALYVTQVENRPPFGGDLMGDDALEFKVIKALLGGETGAVAQVRQAAGGAELPAEAEAWMARAEGLSKLFFEPGSDEPRNLRFRVEFETEIYPAKEFEKNFRLEELSVEFAKDESFEWTAEEPDERRRPVGLPLFGPSGSDFSVVKGTVAKRQGFIGRKIGKKWDPGEGVNAVLMDDAEVKARAEGPLAPLKLLALGASDGDSLKFAFEVPWKKKKDGRIEVSLIVSGTEIETLMELVRNGLEAPPASLGSS